MTSGTCKNCWTKNLEMPDLLCDCNKGYREPKEYSHNDLWNLYDHWEALRYMDNYSAHDFIQWLGMDENQAIIKEIVERNDKR